MTKVKKVVLKNEFCTIVQRKYFRLLKEKVYYLFNKNGRFVFKIWGAELQAFYGNRLTEFAEDFRQKGRL